MNFKNWPTATNTVKVENIPARGLPIVFYYAWPIYTSATAVNEVVTLFKRLIGDVKTSRVCENALGCYLEITFFDKHAASKALCMSGYSVHATNISVSLPEINYRPKRQTDDRRNLYVLGLPFSLTKTEFSNLFSRYGIVMHCVILATVDNASRRRGFVVMSSHEEAKQAMTSLTRTQIKGHCLDISWAVVQRSQGFLDGGDRALPLDSRTNPSSFPPLGLQENHEDGSANSSASSISTGEIDLASLTLSLTPTPTLLVLNLPTLLFSQTQDMHPLFYPFGRIKRLNLAETQSEGTTSAVVEYESAAIAQEAKETLNGQHYIGHQLAVHYVRSKSALLDLASASGFSFHDQNASNTFDSFARQPLLGPVSSRYGSAQNSGRFNNNSQYIGLRAQHPSFNFRQRHTSRSSSTSSRWSVDSVQNPCSWSPNHVTANIARHGLLI
ncbi:putative RNA recognition motif containing protein [Lyophyllum shimeji]|uniref:RNA recognition motif containing protein n=1 Tax=Lyophyllum shimeji TaxID=47721 RepID=A0A9P3PUJ5_LYOSH|nr:putative RNA recognition motif containing protein [Lyophyllum shimeji]